jgi:hypothetical protein
LGTGKIPIYDPKCSPGNLLECIALATQGLPFLSAPQTFA